MVNKQSNRFFLTFYIRFSRRQENSKKSNRNYDFEVLNGYWVRILSEAGKKNQERELSWS